MCVYMCVCVSVCARACVRVRVRVRVHVRVCMRVRVCARELALHLSISTYTGKTPSGNLVGVVHKGGWGEVGGLLRGQESEEAGRKEARM